MADPTPTEASADPPETGRADPNPARAREAPRRRPRRIPVSQAIYERIRDQILTGELAPGTSLPGERRLSEQLDTNRAGVREALKRLVQAGLIQIQHGGATRVLDYRRSGTLDLLQNVMIKADGQVDRRVGRSTLEFRRLLMPEIARRAAQRGTAGCVDALRCAVQEARAAGEDPRRFYAASWKFWEILADASQNLAFVLSLNTLRDVHGRIEAMFQRQHTHTETIEQLEEIILAVEERDGERAQQLVHQGFDRFAALWRERRRHQRRPTS